MRSVRPLPTWSPRAEQDGQVGGVDDAITVEVGRAARIGAPVAEQDGQVGGVYHEVAVEVGRTATGDENGVRILEGATILIAGSHCKGQTAIFFAEPSSSIGEDKDISVVECRLEGTASTTTATGVQVNSDNSPRISGCYITAISDNGDDEAPDGGKAYGVALGGGASIDPDPQITGGLIRSSSGDEREVDVFDIDSTGNSTGEIYISGTRFSKWKGPIKSSERPRIAIQRTVNVEDTDEIGIDDIDLTTMEQTFTSGFENPDVYRVLTVKGTQLFMSGDVFIIGTDFAGNQITEKFELSGTTLKEGVKAFKAIDTIIVPPRQNVGDSVHIGWNTRLGLEFPISGDGAVLQFARKTVSASSYTFEALPSGNATIDEIYATVDVGTITDDDSFEFTVLARFCLTARLFGACTVALM